MEDVSAGVLRSLLCGIIGNSHEWQEYGIAVVEQKSAATSGIHMKTVDPGTSRAAVLRQPDAELGRVVENRLLTSPNAPEKRHIGEQSSYSHYIRKTHRVHRV